MALVLAAMLSVPAMSASASTVHFRLNACSDQGRISPLAIDVGPVRGREQTTYTSTDVHLLPGYYRAFVMRNGCDVDSVFAVLPNADRTIVLPLRAGIHVTTRDDAFAVAGFAPLGSRTALLDSVETGRHLSAPIATDGSYYFDDSDGGHSILSIVDARSNISRFAVDATREHWMLERKDVTIAMARAARGTDSPFHEPTFLGRGVGAMWVLDTPGNRVSRVTTAGALMTVQLPTFNSRPATLAVDRAGNAWVAESGGRKVARITPDGAVREIPLPANIGGSCGGCTPSPTRIRLGSDGRMWFAMTFRAAIGAIDTSGAVSFYAIPGSRDGARDIAMGADGRMWFCGDDLFGAIDPSGRTVTFPSVGNSYAIVPAHDALWVVNTEGSIHHWTLGGRLTSFEVPIRDAYPKALAVDPTGTLWFTDAFGNMVGTMSAAGDVDLRYVTPETPAGIRSADADTRGRIWIGEPNVGAVSSYSDLKTGASSARWTRGDPTSMRSDDTGNMWFLEPKANAVGFFDPAGHDVRIFSLAKRPTNAKGQDTSAVSP